jgi:hypothetical protein
MSVSFLSLGGMFVGEEEAQDATCVAHCVLHRGRFDRVFGSCAEAPTNQARLGFEM